MPYSRNNCGHPVLLPSQGQPGCPYCPKPPEVRRSERSAARKASEAGRAFKVPLPPRFATTAATAAGKGPPPGFDFKVPLARAAQTSEAATSTSNHQQQAQQQEVVAAGPIFVTPSPARHQGVVAARTWSNAPTFNEGDHQGVVAARAEPHAPTFHQQAENGSVTITTVGQVDADDVDQIILQLQWEQDSTERQFRAPSDITDRAFKFATLVQVDFNWTASTAYRGHGRSVQYVLDFWNDHPDLLMDHPPLYKELQVVRLPNIYSGEYGNLPCPPCKELIFLTKIIDASLPVPANCTCRAIRPSYFKGFLRPYYYQGNKCSYWEAPPAGKMYSTTMPPPKGVKLFKRFPDGIEPSPPLPTWSASSSWGTPSCAGCSPTTASIWSGSP